MKTALPLRESFTSTGAKFFAHQEAMTNLRNGKGQPITTHVMATDVCNHKCAFCSVQARAGDALPLADILAYLDILLKYGLKSVILSGGGNPILYKCPKTGAGFNTLVDQIHDRCLEIGLITNGMPLRDYNHYRRTEDIPLDANGKPRLFSDRYYRKSWMTVDPHTLDKLTWVRISMSGLDHAENEIYVPDIDPAKTTLGFSYILHDDFHEPADPHHGRVSTVGDLITVGYDRLHNENIRPPRLAADRLSALTEQITEYVLRHKPAYCRLLPDCLAVPEMETRWGWLDEMAAKVNAAAGYECAFTQRKPPKAPKNCWLGYLHPVLAADGFVYPCDSVTLSAAELGYKAGVPNHKFDQPWRVCRWQDVGKLYTEPIHSLVDSERLCGGCVFHVQNAVLEGVVDGTADITPPIEPPTHINFV